MKDFQILDRAAFDKEVAHITIADDCDTVCLGSQGSVILFSIHIGAQIASLSLQKAKFVNSLQLAGDTLVVRQTLSKIVSVFSLSKRLMLSTFRAHFSSQSYLTAGNGDVLIEATERGKNVAFHSIKTGSAVAENVEVPAVGFGAANFFGHIASNARFAVVAQSSQNFVVYSFRDCKCVLQSKAVHTGGARSAYPVSALAVGKDDYIASAFGTEIKGWQVGFFFFILCTLCCHGVLFRR